MHTTIDTTEFKEILETTARVSTKHVTLPVLQCVLLECGKNELKVKATNLEIGIEGTLSAKTKEEGVIAVPAQVLLQVVNLINEKEITLAQKNDTLTVESGASKTEIKSIESEEFPHIPHITEHKQKINAPLFALGIKTAAFTASQSSIKPELGSVHIFQKKEHSLTFVATDSFRLMEKTVSQQGVIVEDAILVPQKNALELARVIEDIEGDVSLYYNDNQCALSTDRIYITSRLTNGSFPDYEQIIPKEYATHATLLTNDLSHALKKTNVFLNKFMQLTIEVTKTKMVLSSESGDIGTTKEPITASVEGEPITLNFNQRYINEVTPHIVDDSVTLHFAGVGRPVVLESVSDRSMRYLVMPMNK